MKNCLECHDKLLGREDKKFCCDGCRSAFNNRKNNYVLRKNYRILSELNPESKAKTTRKKLINSGFDFTYFTHILQTKTGNTYCFLYSQGYLCLENDLILLVKKEGFL